MRKGRRVRNWRLVEEPAEQAILARLVDLREAGRGAKAIAKTLNGEGQLNPRPGSGWSHGTIGRALTRLGDA